MLKMVTFFQGLPGQQSVPGTLDFPGSPPKPRSTSEAEPEASMSEASSEDLMPSQEAGMARDGEEEESAKKEKKKSKGLANMFSVFTKGKKKKKKGQPRLSDPEVQPKSRPELDGPPPTVEELKEALESGRLEAAWQVLALERELEAEAAASRRSNEELVRQQSKVEALYLLLRDQVLAVLRRPLEAAPERLRQALAVVSQQELEDRRAAGAPVAAVLVATRPRRWLQLWRDSVAEVAAERLDAQPAVVPEGRSEAETRFLHMGCTMKEDLEAVVERLKPLFPAEFNVVHTYAESYHAHFAAQLCTLAQFELCERDTYFLLLWVLNLYPNDILNSPKLAKELQGIRLGSLLPPKQIRLLEAVFLSNEVTNVKLLMTRALELESQRWARDVAPQSLDGHYHSELAIDIIQIVLQGQDKAENITPEVGVQIRQLLLVELAALLRSYQRTFDEFLEKSKLLTNYRANIIANINNCLSFRTSVEQKWQIPQDTLNHMLDPLKDLKAHGFDTLLQSLFSDLKPLFKKFTQTRWATPVETLEEIIATVGIRLPEFSELKDCFQEELMGAVHLHLVKEYIIRLSKRRVVLKTEEQQQQLARHILANADVIQHFCTQNGSNATWLNQALPRLAEIIHLQDSNAIKIEVATYATLYPDFSKGHLNAILAIKGNLLSSEVRSIRNILDINTGVQEPSRPLFSLIKVG
ncbi:tumor necrosis factor alpha-induced protein 2 [Peromyscus maniculatus bairdii]|uniref:tumor necrosis factor alpha-induced protein 2 n=1 Tax=Peromyscus maniculatus bairdii TaxID=230844 RepID=UPI00042A99C0|nr:tumor necrosis factor alpha-induced protein 2 [Peromyscus maniculatus bairdii]XP_015861935.1 tumor necrosis factor alpha-induced protein 2 [Peromyscus maniculatus bairdii]